MSGKVGRSGRRPGHARGPLTFGAKEKPVPQTETPPVPSSVVAGLGAPGQAFTRGVWQAYDDWQPEQETLLRECGVTVDALAEYADRLKLDGRTIVGPRGALGPHPAVRLQSQAQRTLLLLLRALDLKEG